MSEQILPKNQAQRIAERFGCPNRLALALQRLADPKLHRTRSNVWRWTQPRSKGGTGGRIPSCSVDAVKAAARLEGVVLRVEDWLGEDA